MRHREEPAINNTADDLRAVVSSGLDRCCGTCKHWRNPKTPQTYRKRHCYHSGYYGGNIKNDSTSDCKWESANDKDQEREQ